MARETGNFDYLCSTETSSDIVMIWDGNAELNSFINQIDPREFFTVGTFLESIRLDVYLPSFDKAGFPEVFPEMSAAEKNQSLLNVEQAYPKTGIAFYRKKASETNWHYLSEIVLQNRGRRSQIPALIPYFTTNQIKILSRGTQIGIKLIDYGQGLIGQGPIEVNRVLDQVQIEAEFRFDIDEIKVERRRRVSHQETILVGAVPQTILAANPLRTAYEFQNQGTEAIFFAFGETPEAVISGGFKVAPGALAYSPRISEVEAIWARSAVEKQQAVAVREVSCV